jgi:hypothetical protein
VRPHGDSSHRSSPAPHARESPPVPHLTVTVDPSELTRSHTIKTVIHLLAAVIGPAAHNRSSRNAATSSAQAASPPPTLKDHDLAPPWLATATNLGQLGSGDHDRLAWLLRRHCGRAARSQAGDSFHGKHSSGSGACDDRCWAEAQVRIRRWRAAAGRCFQRWCLQPSELELAIHRSLLFALSGTLPGPGEMVHGRRTRKAGAVSLIGGAGESAQSGIGRTPSP